MKQLVKNYSFDKSTGAITFTDFGTIRLDRVLLITDATNNTLIYQFNDSSLGGSVSTNVLTLAFNTNTGSFNNGDALQIFYDSASGDPIYDLPIVTGNVASGSADSGSPVKVGGVYNSSAPALSNGQRVDLQMDSGGNAKTYIATKLDSINDSITNYAFGHSYQNITSNATTTVKASVGVLVGLIVGDPGATWQAILYDNTSGSGTIITTFKFSTAGFFALGPLAFITGLTVVTSGTTPGNITPVWR